MTIRHPLLARPGLQAPVDPVVSLHHAARSGDLASLRAHLCDAAPHDRDPEGATPLHLAVQFGQAPAVRLLLEAGASANARRGRWLRPLHVAAAQGDLASVHALLDHGADVDATDGAGFTALHTAAAAGHAEVVRRLVLGGADPEKPVGDHLAVDLARASGDWATLGLLLQVTRCGTHRRR